MSSAAHDLLSRALELSSDEREELAAELVGSLDREPDTATEQAWLELAERRAREALAGGAGVPWAEDPCAHRNFADDSLKAVAFHPEVEAEVAGAFDWYDRKRSGLGEKLLRAIDLAVERIVEAPMAHSVVADRGGVVIR